ncbi:MAG: DNA translocase FtsK [Clostridia bacterium]|nr:DNA translocase FtsK [Clostridia bacterium]
MAKYSSHNLNEKKGMTARTKWGISLFSVSLFLFIFSVFNIIVPIHNFVLGTFGLCVYPILLFLMVVGVFLMLKKRYYIEKLYFSVAIALFFVIVCFFQLVLTNTNMGFGEYLTNCYNAKNTVGGVLMGIITYILFMGLGMVGTILILAIMIVLGVALIVNHFLKIKEYRQITNRTISFPVFDKDVKKVDKVLKTKKEKTPIDSKLPEKDEKIITNITLDGYQAQKQEKSDAKKILLSKTSYKDEDDMAVRIFGEDFVNSIKTSSKKDAEEKKEYHISDLYKNQKEDNTFSFNDKNENKPSRFIHTDEEELISAKLDINPEKEEELNFIKENSFDDILDKTDEEDDIKQETKSNDEIIEESDDDFNNPFTLKLDDNLKQNQENKEEEETKSTNFEQDNFVEENNIEDDEIDFSKIQEEKVEQPKNDEKNFVQENSFNFEKEIEEKTVAEQPKPKKIHKPYVKPPIEYLTTKSSVPENNEQECQAKALILEQTLESFKISAKVVGITRGPAVTRYELQMPIGIPVKRITQHNDDITMMMESRASVRIETPIPGRSLVGVEVPNEKISTIGLKDIIESPAFSQSKGKLTFALGKDITGDCKVCELEAMPHLLVAGSTGSGKSVCLNVLLISLLYKLGPDELKLLLIDPKRVEFVSYNYLPHMLVPRAINDAQQAINALDWAIAEMMRRYQVFSERNVRNFKEYNSSDDVLSGEEEKLPYIVIVIDELADIMMMAGRDLEEKIQRLTQLARAAGIHLIIATQRPSVDVITGVIKSNMPSRIAFAVTDFASSKTILDKGGADKLLGKGDMLYAPQNLPEPIRIQCPYVDSKEVTNIVEFIKANNEADFDDTIAAFISKNDKSGGGTGGSEVESSGESQNKWDPLLPQALLDFIQTGSCSASMIQRRHSIGFVRAGRIVDQMEQAGFISPLDPSKRTRTVLITLEKYNEIFGEDEQ